MDFVNEQYNLSLILPVYNEEDNILKVIDEVACFLKTQKIVGNYEIIVVDDGSKDNTASILDKIIHKNCHVRIITSSKNSGYGRALISGVKDAKYPLIFFMDADRQFDIKEINKLFLYLRDFDIISGCRYQRKDAFFRVIFGKIYTFLTFLLFGLGLKDINSGFKLFKKEIFDGKQIRSTAGVFYAEVLAKAKKQGYKIKEIPVAHFPRLAGRQKGLTLKVIFEAIIDLIKLKCELFLKK